MTQTFLGSTSTHVFRGISDADCQRQAEADVAEGRRLGYEPQSQSWAEDNGMRVLTVSYLRTSGSKQARLESSPTVFLTNRQWALIAGIGGLVMVAGGLLPWVTITAGLVGTVGRSGLEVGDGAVVIVIGIVAGLASLSGATADPLRVRRLLLVLGVVGLGLGLLEAYNMNAKLQDIDESLRSLASIGIGIWLVVIGGAVTALGGYKIDAWGGTNG